MSAFIARSLLLSLCLFTRVAQAESLALPDKLIDLRSPEGTAFLNEAGAREAFLPISVTFETQKTQSYCGVASMVMALNAIHAPAPTSPEYRPYASFTQDNLLNDATDAILPRDVLAHHGMTLDQLGQLFALHPVIVDVHHAETGALDAFRQSARAYLAAKDHYVVVNYLRRALGQERGGHISPLAAYDEKTDRFLILDVARYKYPPVWVTASDLFDAMNTTDGDNENKTRGYVLVSKAPDTTTATH
jgi:hypothetical protein